MRQLWWFYVPLDYFIYYISCIIYTEKNHPFILFGLINENDFPFMFSSLSLSIFSLLVFISRYCRTDKWLNNNWKEQSRKNNEFELNDTFPNQIDGYWNWANHRNSMELKNYLMVNNNHIKIAFAVRYVVMSLLIYGFGGNRKYMLLDSFQKCVLLFDCKSHNFKSKFFDEV